MRFLRAGEAVELASSSATQYLWLINRKMKFQVIGIDRCQLLVEEQLKKSGKEEEKDAKSATEQRIE